MGEFFTDDAPAWFRPPATTPDYMLPAWFGCLSWAAGEPEVRKAFKAKTGMALSGASNPLGRMIDKATGHDLAVAKAFVEFVNDELWGDVTAPLDEDDGP